VADFDRLIDEWLEGRPARLRKILLGRARNATQRQRIRDLLGSSDDGPDRDTISALRPSGSSPENVRGPSIELDPDVAVVFTDSESANTALRALIELASKVPQDRRT
jgi:hypothetical protein